MKPMGIALCAIACSVSLSAQIGQTETKSKVEIEGGKTVTVIGCVRPVVAGKSFMLTNAADRKKKKPETSSYMLTSDDNLPQHVGHLVQITGKATDRGNDAKLKVETKSKTQLEGGNDTETHRKSVVDGDILGVPYLDVKSLKMIAASCP